MPEIQIQEERRKYKYPGTYRDIKWEREQQLITQRALLEKLRAKKYVTDKSIFFMQKLGNFGRQYQLPVAIIAYLYFIYMMFR